MKALTLFMALCLFTSTLIAQSKKDKESVIGVINSFQNDFNQGEFNNANTYTTEDWEHINPNGGISKGRENVLKEVRMVHQSFLKGIRINIESMEIRFLNPRVAIADVVHSIDNYVSPDGRQHTNEKQIKTYVIIKQKGKWLLTQDQNTIILI
jgi:uncharacterized protein (TIGR02246 family)